MAARDVVILDEFPFKVRLKFHSAGFNILKHSFALYIQV